MWKMVRSCLDDERCCRALEASQQILEQLKEERLLQSEKAETSSSSSESETEEELERLAKRLEKNKLYPCGKPHVPLLSGTDYCWPPRIRLDKQPMCTYAVKFFAKTLPGPGMIMRFCKVLRV